MAMSLEQQRAVALARARRRRQGSTGIAAGEGQSAPVVPSSVMTFGENTLDGIPIVGPALTWASDRAAAGVSSLITGDYEGDLAGSQQRRAAGNEASPNAAMAGQITGNVAGTVPMVMAAPGAFGAAVGQSLPARVGFGLLSGGALGSGDAAIRAEEGQGLNDAIIGGGAGAALGGGVPLAGRGISAAYRAIADAIARTGRTSSGLSPGAAEALQRVLSSDDAIPGAMQGNFAAAGPEAMLVDAGPTAQSALDTAIARGGPGTAIAARAVDARAGRATEQITGALDQSLGAPSGVESGVRGIREATAPARGAAYDAAYSTPIDYAAPAARDLEGLFGRIPPSVLARANALMRTEGVTSGQILADLADDGSVIFRQMPDVRQLDYIARALQDVGRAGDGMGALGGQTSEGRAYMGLAREIRGRMRELVPEYGTALDTAADPIARIEALRFGQTMLSPATTRDEAAEFIAGMSQAELAAVRSGVRAQIDEALANVRATMTDPNIDARQGSTAIRALSSDAAREKLGLILGDEQARQLFAQLDQAARAFDLRGSVATNSRTYGRGATERAVAAATDEGVLGQVGRGKPLGALQSIVQAIMEMTPGDQLARQDNIFGEIARALTQPATPAQRQIADALAQVQGRVTSNAGQAARIARLVGIGGASLVPLGGSLARDR